MEAREADAAERSVEECGVAVAKKVLRQCVALIEPVGLQPRLKGAANLEDGDGGEGVEAEEHAHRVVVQVVARVRVAVG